MNGALIKFDRKPRMSDIAVSSGVSIGTVSRVLNDKEDVAPELRERVKRAARELGYAMRSSNRQSNPKNNALGTIAYLLDNYTARNLAETFQQHFLTGVEQRANELEGHILYTSCGEEIEQNKLPSIVLDKSVRGAIVKGVFPEAWIKKLSASVPTVLLMTNSPSHAYSSVNCDNLAATYQILHYLQDMGHRRIGFIYEKEVHSPTSHHHLEREDAFRKHTVAMGLEFMPEYIQTPTRDNANEDISDIMARGLKNFIALGSKRPTALIGAADPYALSILRIAETFHLSVPRDLSVVGYMDTDACEYSNPPLTSMCLSGEELGRAAVDLLESRIKSPTSIVRHMVVGPRLVERLSCAAPMRVS